MSAPRTGAWTPIFGALPAGAEAIAPLRNADDKAPVVDSMLQFDHHVTHQSRFVIVNKLAIGNLALFNSLVVIYATQSFSPWGSPSLEKSQRRLCSPNIQKGLVVRKYFNGVIKSMP